MQLKSTKLENSESFPKIDFFSPITSLVLLVHVLKGGKELHATRTSTSAAPRVLVKTTDSALTRQVLIFLIFFELFSFLGSFSCQCQTDFDGDRCELELNACATRLDPCDDNGTSMCENLDPIFVQPPFSCLCNPGRFEKSN